MICQHCEDVEADRECFVAHERHPECFHRRQGSVWCTAEGGPHPDCRVCERCWDGLPVDETCDEFPCRCYPDLRAAAGRAP